MNGEMIRVRWAGEVVDATVLRRYKNGRILVEFTPAPSVAGYARGRRGSPAKVERMVIEGWQEVGR